MALTQISQAGAKDEAINEAKLQISNAGTNGQYLQKQSGNTGGLTWATVSAGMTDVVSDTSPQLGGDLDTNSFEISLDDDHKVKFGDGSDLQIYHAAGTINRIDSVNEDLAIRRAGTAEDMMIKCVADGAVELYHDGVKKLNTHADGIEVLGKLYMADSKNIELGNSQDLKIYHDGTDNYIYSNNKILRIQGNGSAIKINPVNAENCANFNANGSVDLYYDNGLKFITTSAGARVLGGEGAESVLELWADEGDDDGDKWRLRGETSGELKIQTYASGSWEKSIECNGNGNVELYYNGTKKFETTSTGVEILRGTSDTELKITAHNTTSQSRLLFADSSGIDANVSYDHNDRKLYLGTAASGGLEGDLTIDANGHVIIPSDSGRLKIGAGEDLHIYHSGSHSYITNAGTGRLYINAEQINLHNKAVDENMLRAVQDGEVELYYDGTKRFETTSAGAKVTGTFNATGHATFDGNIYVDANDANDIGSGAERIRHFYGASSIDMIDDGEIRLGTGDDLKLYHNGTHSYIQNDGGNLYLRATASETGISIIPNGAVKLFYNDTAKLETTSTGVTINGLIVDGTLNLGDSKKLVAGNGSDLEIYHDGTNSIIDNDTNDLIIRCDSDDLKLLAEDDILLRDNDDSTNFVHCINGGAVELFHNGTKRFETTSAGVKADNICKAWCNYDGRDNSVRNSFNISSVTDNGTGDYSFNWTTATANDFAFVGTAGEWLKSGTDRRVLSYRHGSDTNDYGDSSYLKVRTFGLNTNQTADSKVVSIAVYSE